MPKKPILDPELFIRTQIILPDFDVALERYKKTCGETYSPDSEYIFGISREIWNELNKKIIIVKQDSNPSSIACLIRKDKRLSKDGTNLLDYRNLCLCVFTKAQRTAIKKYFKEEV